MRLPKEALYSIVKLMNISFVIPAYNEEKALGGALRDLISLNLSAEIIVVDDGSSDRTAEIAREFPVKVIHHESNKGYGAAIKTGIKNSSGELIAICDADGTYPIGAIPELINFAQEYDMVVGARSFASISFLRRPAKWFLNKLANYLVDYKIPDLNSGLRVFRKDVALNFLHLLPQGFSLTTTLTIALLANNYQVKFVPIAYNKRIGRSKIRPIRDTLNFFQLIVRVVMYFNPLKVFLPVSLFLFMSGLAILGVDLFVRRDVGDASVVTLNTAILIFMLGLLADLINKKSSYK